MRRFIATALLPLALVACASFATQQDPLEKGVDAYRAKDYAAARVQWTIAADQGDATAQNDLGYLLHTGLGGPGDAQRAVALWQQAAAAGHSEAQLHLGAAYAEGIGTEQDLAQAYAWCRCALATAEGANDAAPASVRGRIAADARHCLSVVQGELNEEQMQQGTRLAAACRQPRAGLYLVAEDAGVDVRDADGRTALMSASARGDGDVVARLLKEGAQPDLRDQAFGKTALMYAAQNDRGPVAEKLLLAGAGPDIKDNQGWTALCYAALNIRPGAVLVLLGAHASVNVQTKDGRTPLIIAAREGNAKTVELLLDAGADPNLQDRDGRTALWWASSKGFAAVQSLLERRSGAADAGTAGER